MPAAHSVGERKRRVALGAQKMAGRTVDPMTREEIEAYIDKRLLQGFPELSPMGGYFSIFFASLGDYCRDERGYPTFAVVSKQLFKQMSKEAGGHPAWRSVGRDAKQVAGVRIIQGVGERDLILFGR